MKKQTYLFPAVYFKLGNSGSCYVSKVTSPVKNEDTGIEDYTESKQIILANVGKCEIDKEGRWDVEAIRMKNGRGWIVVSASFCTDVVSLDERELSVALLVNGKLAKWRKGEKIVPIKYDPSKGFPIERTLRFAEKRMNECQGDFIDCGSKKRLITKVLQSIVEAGKRVDSRYKKSAKTSTQYKRGDGSYVSFAELSEKLTGGENGEG